MRKIVWLLLFIAGRLAAQDDDISKRTVIVFITSEVIAEKNFKNEAFITWVKSVQQAMGGLMKTEKSNSVVKIIARWARDRKCAYDIGICPVNDILAEKTKAVLTPISSPIAEFASFEIMLTFKFNEGCNAPETFSPELLSGSEALKQTLSSQTLAQRKETIKNWAYSEAMPVLSYFTKNVDASFPGVQATGISLEKKNFLNKQTVTVTDKNPLYWRGVMEMNKGNLIIPLSKVFMHIVNDEFDLARRYLGMLFRFADKESLASHYLLELNRYLEIFYQRHDSLVHEGIKLHDAGKYDEAIKVYNGILTEYPNSAWARYELYFSSTYKSTGPGREAAANEQWKKNKDAIYAADPLYPMGGGASNAKDGYQLFKHLQIKDLFTDSKKLKTDLFTYADIALDLGCYAFAGHLYWYLATRFPEEKYKGHNLLIYYLYSLQKLGVTEVQSFFKDNFKDEISSLDKEREDAMKNDPIYKSFKE